MSSAWALIEHHDEVLFIRRALDRGRGGQWCLPGGTMWKGERPDVACVREAFEETGLRVAIRQPLAVFKDAHYFLCTLHSKRDALDLRQVECSDAHWIDPSHLLKLGTVMDLRRMIPLFEQIHIHVHKVPAYLTLAIPDLIF